MNKEVSFLRNRRQAPVCLLRNKIILTYHRCRTVFTFLLGRSDLSPSPFIGTRVSFHMEFLHPFLRRHLAGKPVVTSLNVGCFLRLRCNIFSHLALDI